MAATRADTASVRALVESGEYVIDAHAVAEAMLRRAGSRWRPPPGSVVLVPPKADPLVALPPEQH